MRRGCEVEVFSRVTGFYRPVQSWNKGKTSEFADRKRFNMEGIEEQSEANAKLIAAAPDLLNACIKLMEASDGKGDYRNDYIDSKIEIRKAIKKATS